jgi:hypothetical protein
MTYSEQLQLTRSKNGTVWLYALLFFLLGGTIAVSISHSALLLLPVGFVCVLAGVIGSLMLKLDEMRTSPVKASSDEFSQVEASLDELMALAAQATAIAETAAEFARRKRDMQVHRPPAAPQVPAPAATGGFYRESRPAQPERADPGSIHPQGPTRR